MNIDSLKVFCLVVNEGSVSQAARLSYVSQPAVTRQIRQLEDEYGVLLFDRVDGKLSVTEAGRQLYPLAKGIIEDFTQSKNIILQSAGKQHAHLNVGASLTIGEYLLPNLLGRFKKQEPDIKLTLTIKNTPSVLEDLANDLVDIAMVEGEVENSDVLVEKFADDELVFICHSEHPWSKQTKLQLNDLAGERMIWREPSSGTRRIVERSLEEYGVLDKIESYMEIGSTQAIKSAVEAGLGISILPKLTVLRELAAGHLHEIVIEGIQLQRSLWLVNKPKRFRSRSIDVFMSFIQANKNM